MVNHTPWYELAYCDSRNMRQFSFFTMQFFPPTQKIVIPNISFFFKKQKQNWFLLLLLKQFHYTYIIFYENSYVVAACELS